MKKTLIDALKQSGEILLYHLGDVQKISLKGDQSIVTEIDLQSEKHIITLIKERFPGHNIIAEETGCSNKESEYCWVIDPLDGTSNYAAGLSWFGTIICLLKNNIPVMGAIHLPYYNAIYFAEKGKGSFLNGQQINVSSEKKLKNVLFAYSLDYSEVQGKTETEGRIIAALVKEVRNLRATNSVVDFCYTAEGKFGGCLNQTTKIWDIAAPYLLINECGGVATDILGNDIVFNTTQTDFMKNYTFMAANKCLHSLVKDIVSAIVK